MDIQVNEDYKLTSDSMNVIINRKKIVDPKKSPNWPKMQAEGKSGEPYEKWEEVSYHSTVDRALEWILDRQIKESDAQSISELLEDIKGFKAKIRAVLAS